jgi:hypothetical protein
MFDSVWTWFHPLCDAKIGAVGDPYNHCSPPVADHCRRVDMMHQGVISVPKNNMFRGENIKFLNPVKFKGYGKLTLLTSEGPSFVDTTEGARIFSFTGRVDPQPAIVDGIRVDWTSPPEEARILVSPFLTGKLHKATGWIVTKSEGRVPGNLPQSQNIIFSQPENVRRIEVQMKDAASSSKTQFGIDQVSLVTNSKDVLARAF